MFDASPSEDSEGLVIPVSADEDNDDIVLEEIESSSILLSQSSDLESTTLGNHLFNDMPISSAN